MNSNERQRISCFFHSEDIHVGRSCCRLKAVLVVIAIPVFTSQLNNAKLAADAANVRAKYAELVVAAIDSDSGSAAIATTDLQAACTNGSTVAKSSDGKYIEISLAGATKSPAVIKIGANNVVS